MPLTVDFKSLQFGEPQWLWLLLIPAGLAVLWMWQVALRRRDRAEYARARTVPVRERVSLTGGLLFWLCLIVATALTIVALSEPRAIVSTVRTAGIDLIALQDGSASMSISDMSGATRWQRSVRFLRTLAESVSWKDDRLAMAVFAKLATPQVRLTRDPNTFFFFLDHLAEKSPFSLDNDISWDTNIESGVYWGLRLLDKDAELHGKSKNAKGFVLLSDGQAWSGEVERALRTANARDVPVYVVGVGTVEGGLIPEPSNGLGETPAPTIRGILDRQSLVQIAAHGGGTYFELGRGDDRTIANQIVDGTRRHAGSTGIEQRADDLYWRFLAIAATLICLGAVSLRERAELWMAVLGAAILLQILATVTR